MFDAPSRRYRFRPSSERLEARCLLADGALDPTFGAGGLVRLNYEALAGGPYNASGDVMALQADGKIVVAGASPVGGGGWAIMASRLTRTGTLDPGFGNGGQLALPLGNGVAQVTGVFISQDGAILVVGSHDGDAVMARLESDGTPDPSFGSGGVAQVDLPGLTFSATSATLQVDGRFLIGGQFGDFGGPDFAVTRLSATGRLDTSFGAGGVAIVPFDLTANGTDVVHAVASLPDGGILLAGYAETDAVFALGRPPVFAIARLTANGSLDETFGEDGRQTIPLDGEARGLAVQPDGKVVLVGSDGDKLAVARLNPNGTPDATFSSNGTALIEFTTLYGAFGTSVAIQSDGKLVIAGTTKPGLTGVGDIIATRLLPNGQIDTSFNSNGKQVLNFQNDDYGAAVALQPDGKILISGRNRPLGSFYDDLIVTRLLASPVKPAPNPTPTPTPLPVPNPTPTPQPTTPGGQRPGGPNVIELIPPAGEIWYVGGPPPRITRASLLGARPLLISIHFSEALSRGPARNRRFYRLQTAGRDGRFGTRDDWDMPIRSATYDALTHAVALRIPGRAWRNGPLRLTVSGRLTGANGGRLDGNSDGWAGDSYVGLIENSSTSQ